MLIFLLASVPAIAKTYPVTGMLLKVDRAHRTMIVSSDAIPGYMEAMTMPYEVREEKSLDGLVPGMLLAFSLVVEKNTSFAEDIRIRSYESAEQEPLQARRLKLFEQLNRKDSTSPLAVGQAVPNFTLTDQTRKQISLRQFSGKVVAINFVYTRCPLPQYCFRISNNFGRLKKRFQDRLGRDLVLLTITFDPVHDQPEVLAEYAKTWKADNQTWHFLTGSPVDVDKICEQFGVGFWQDEGTLTHSLHTAVVDREGKLVANIEGNQFSSEQLGDLVESVLEKPR